MYDSTDDTMEHINKVRWFLIKVAVELIDRGVHHDESKLVEPEKSVIDEFTPKMKHLIYNSPEYQQCLKEMKPALDYHYTHNSHHSEFYPNGINDMNLIDIVELLLDWLAATQRNPGGDIYKSIEIGKTRFGISDQLSQIFINTVKFFEEKEETNGN